MAERREQDDLAEDPRACLPLSGLEVLDLSNFLAGPMVGMFLADFGAQVTKVERPATGDEVRMWGHDKGGVGLYAKVINRNKKSVTADLRTPLGVEIVKRLARTADVAIENFRPGTLERWGLGYQELSADNEGLVLVRVSGFGQTGPYSRRPGFGTLAEGFSSYAHITGEPGGPPLLPGFGLADSTTGLCGAYLTMVALHARDRLDGKGQVIDLAIYEPLFTLLGPQVVNYDQLGEVQGRDGSRLPFTAPRNTFRTKDEEWVIIAGSAQSTFIRICTALDCAELISDSRFADNRMRLAHADELDEALERAIGRFDLAEILARCDESDATVGTVYDVRRAFEDPHYQARENIIAVPDDELGTVRMQNVVGNLSATPGAVRHAGPRVGEHNREILVEALGFDEAILGQAGYPLAPSP
jgi:crotonobetainyl-CoA:carnitine CoA-transferase CaiB-like acyl-CoA transferase